MPTIHRIHQDVHTLSIGVHPEAGLTNHFTVSRRVGCSGGDDCIAGVVETGPHSVVDGVGTGPLRWVKEGPKVATGGITNGVGVAGPDTVVGGWGVVCGDVLGFEVGEIGLAAHV